MENEEKTDLKKLDEIRYFIKNNYQTNPLSTEEYREREKILQSVDAIRMKYLNAHGANSYIGNLANDLIKETYSYIPPITADRVIEIISMIDKIIDCMGMRHTLSNDRLELCYTRFIHYFRKNGGDIYSKEVNKKIIEFLLIDLEAKR